MADVVHDLAAPLQLASGYLSLLEGGWDLDGEAATLAGRAIERAAALLPRLAALATAAAPPAPDLVDPGRLLQDVLDVLASRDRYAPDVVIDGLGRSPVIADPAQLACAFEVLLSAHRPTRIEAGPSGDGGWELAACGIDGDPEVAGPAAVWQLIVERQGGVRRDALDSRSVRFWLPCGEARPGPPGK